MYFFELRRILRQKVRRFQQSPAGKNLTQLPKLKLALIMVGFASAWHIIGRQIAEYKNPGSMQKAAEAAITNASQKELEDRDEQENTRRRAVAQANMDKITSRPVITVAKTQYPLDCD